MLWIGLPFSRCSRALVWEELPSGRVKEIEQAACFRVRQRRLRCQREGLFAEAAEWLGSEDVYAFSGTSSDLRRETHPR